MYTLFLACGNLETHAHPLTNHWLFTESVKMSEQCAPFMGRGWVRGYSPKLEDTIQYNFFLLSLFIGSGLQKIWRLCFSQELWQTVPRLDRGWLDNCWHCIWSLYCHITNNAEWRGHEHQVECSMPHCFKHNITHSSIFCVHTKSYNSTWMSNVVRFLIIWTTNINSNLRNLIINFVHARLRVEFTSYHSIIRMRITNARSR